MHYAHGVNQATSVPADGKREGKERRDKRHRDEDERGDRDHRGDRDRDRYPPLLSLPDHFLVGMSCCLAPL